MTGHTEQHEAGELAWNPWIAKDAYPRLMPSIDVRENVEVLRRDGRVNGPYLAGRIEWLNSGTPSDILFWRPCSTPNTEPAGGWQPIETAPYNTPVEIQVGRMTMWARLLPGVSMTEDEQPCDQWQAEYEGEHPPCWSGGACWSSNENEDTSIPPSAWLKREGSAPAQDSRTPAGGWQQEQVEDRRG